MDEFRPVLFAVRQPQPSTYLAVDLGPATTVEIKSADEWPTVVIDNEVALLSLCPTTPQFNSDDVAVADQLVAAFTAYRAAVAALAAASDPAADPTDNPAADPITDGPAPE